METPLSKLDTKDLEIIYELDRNYRQSFSKIGKKVKLSKNSVALRFEKIKEYTLANMAGLNYEVMGLTIVKVYYSFDFYNEETEKVIVREAKKYKSIYWIAKYYGIYDICIALLIDNIDDFVLQIIKFDDKFAGRINKKEIEIFSKQHYFRYNFLYKKPHTWTSKIEKTGKKIKISNLDRKILRAILYNPRINVIEVARVLGISPKTVSKRMKQLQDLGIIMGYFMTLDVKRFNHDTYILLVQLHNSKKCKEFEAYLSSIKNLKFFGRMLGLWDYEVSFIYPCIAELQKQIELMKEKFSNLFKKIEIMSFGKRIYINPNII